MTSLLSTTTTSSTGPQSRRQRENERVLRTLNEKSRQARDIPPIPPIKDPERRKRAKEDLRFHLEAYHPEKWYLGWADDHLTLIEYLQDSFLGRSADDLIAVALARGSGKTSIARGSVEWAILHGHLRWPILLEADAEAFLKQMRAFQITFRTKEVLADDFPETIWVIQQMSTSQAAPNMTCNGEPMNIIWKTSEIVLPTNYLSLERGTASGVISGGGITGSVRGAQVTLATGEILRPDAFVINDPQTRESAMSPKQIQDRINIISADLLGMGGPGKPMRGVMTMTVIAKNDLADRVLGPEFPQWRSIRGKWLRKWPRNMDLWQQYGSLLRRLKAEGLDLEPANEFYQSNRETRYGLGWKKPGMDEGAEVYWDARVNPPYVSSLQSFMSWWILDPSAAMAEGNNEPEDPHEPQDVVYCSREEILAKLSALERFQCPNEAADLVVFIDVQLGILIYAVAAVTPDFQRYIADYGTFPDQKREYWTKRQLGETLSDHWDSPKQAWVEGLRVLTQVLTKTEWRKTNGQRLHITMGCIDAAWGESTDSVFQFCREDGGSIWFPSFGVGIGPSSSELNYGSEQKAWQKRHVDWGPHWHRRTDHDRGNDAYRYDANFFKSAVHTGIATPEQDPGSLQLFQGDHQLVADHLRAEWPDKKAGRGREMVVWEERAGKPDNDLFDCFSGCGMVASARKVQIPGMEGFGVKPKKLPPQRWTQDDFGRA